MIPVKICTSNDVEKYLRSFRDPISLDLFLTGPKETNQIKSHRLNSVTPQSETLKPVRVTATENSGTEINLIRLTIFRVKKKPKTPYKTSKNV